MINLKTIKPAKRYSEAFFDTIKDKDNKQILSELKEIKNLFLENSEFKDLMLHPVISTEKKKEVFGEVLKNCSFDTKNFIFLLIEENRIDCIVDIYDFLEDKINKIHNITKLSVTLAIDPDEEIKSGICGRLKEKLNSDIQAEFKKDENIIGGIIIQIQDMVIDLSLKKKLEKFRQM